MEDLGQEPVILPPQVIEKPTSVTVFGLLNIVFGGLGLICTSSLIIGLPFFADKLSQTEITVVDKISFIVGIGLSIWELTLGIGLLKLKRWARRGTVIYASCDIIWVLLGIGMSIFYLSTGRMNLSDNNMPGYNIYIGQSCGMIIPLIYPILLLIFMQTNKVKEVFGAIGG
jgi:hypothetical protein